MQWNWKCVFVCDWKLVIIVVDYRELPSTSSRLMMFVFFAILSSTIQLKSMKCPWISPIWSKLLHSPNRSSDFPQYWLLTFLTLYCMWVGYFHGMTLMWLLWLHSLFSTTDFLYSIEHRVVTVPTLFHSRFYSTPTRSCYRSQYSLIIIIIIVVVSLLVHTFDNNVVTTLSLILISYTLDRQYENLFLNCQICKFQFIVETRRFPNDQHKLECKIRLVISLQSTALIPRRRLFITLVKSFLSNIELVQLMGTLKIRWDDPGKDSMLWTKVTSIHK